jgi:hypothetical protein
MQDFNGMSIKELRELRNAAGLPSAKHESKEAIVRQLTVAAFPEAILKEFQQKPVIRQAPEPQMVVALTPEQVTEGLQSYINRGLKVRFDDISWFIKNGAAEDSGNLAMPIAAIRTAADRVMKARLPAQVTGEFDPMTSAIGRLPVMGL